MGRIVSLTLWTLLASGRPFSFVPFAHTLAAYCGRHVPVVGQSLLLLSTIPLEYWTIFCTTLLHDTVAHETSSTNVLMTSIGMITPASQDCE